MSKSLLLQLGIEEKIKIIKILRESKAVTEIEDAKGKAITTPAYCLMLTLIRDVCKI